MLPLLQRLEEVPSPSRRKQACALQRRLKRSAAFLSVCPFAPSCLRGEKNVPKINYPNRILLPARRKPGPSRREASRNRLGIFARTNTVRSSPTTRGYRRRRSETGICAAMQGDTRWTLPRTKTRSIAPVRNLMSAAAGAVVSCSPTVRFARAPYSMLPAPSCRRMTRAASDVTMR